jgi:hypothetical protein
MSYLILSFAGTPWPSSQVLLRQNLKGHGVNKEKRYEKKEGVV